MLSTLSSLLPAALTDKLDKLEMLRGEEAGLKDQTEDEGGVKRRDMAEESNKKEKKKKVSSNETFIVVRPPPAKSNHPLNLQLQLVPAHNSKDRSAASAASTPTNSRFSVDFTRENEVVPPAGQPSTSPGGSDEQGLKRSESVRSNRSDASQFYASSAAASTGSVTSFASSASTSSARRMIIPLYNLSAHNVMTNTVLDAGTDARVARFMKRGIEIVGLAILEPTEVWNGHGKEGALGLPIQRSTSGTSSLAPPGQNGSRAATPDPSHSPGSSRLSLSSEHSSAHGHAVADPTSTPAAPPPTGAKKLFGRIFRKKDGGGGHTPSTSITSIPAPPTAPAPPTPTADRPTEILLPAVLGLSPTLAGSANPPSGRCIAYVWPVRKWLKTEGQGLISGVLGKIGREASAHGVGHVGMQDPAEWEVRFEWERGRSKGEKARRAARRRSVDAAGVRRSRTPSRRNSALVPLEEAPMGHDRDDGVAVVVESPRQSLDVVRERHSARTPSPSARRPPVSASAKAISVSSTTPSDDEGTPPQTVDDAGNESDPEDSETPWTCSLVLTHPAAHPHLAPPITAFTKGHSRTRTVSSSGAVLHPPSTPTPASFHTASVSESGHTPHPAHPPTPIKIKVATLSPAPHHPKVVCQLKIPFPLPDVEVHQGVLRKRLVLGDGSTRSTVPRDGGALVMTAEEIKDVVCSTGFWVIVREGFGGVGKKGRKGDGWKIRG